MITSSRRGPPPRSIAKSRITGSNPRRGARNVGFAVVARRHSRIHAALLATLVDDDTWHPALTQTGEHRPGAAVIELTDTVELSGWPEGTRPIVRREPLHPGAQRSLLESETYRYWGHYTDQAGTPVDLDTAMRAHARVEDHIRRLKASGLERFPFTDLAANQAWMQTVAHAADLVRWFQLLCLTGPLAAAEPKTLRWRLWHAPPALCARAAPTSSASSTAGPTPQPSSAATDRSTPSPDRPPSTPSRPNSRLRRAPPHPEQPDAEPQHPPRRAPRRAFPGTRTTTTPSLEAIADYTDLADPARCSTASSKPGQRPRRLARRAATPHHLGRMRTGTQLVDPAGARRRS
jgi:hypothetical protein